VPVVFEGRGREGDDEAGAGGGRELSQGNGDGAEDGGVVDGNGLRAELAAGDDAAIVRDEVPGGDGGGEGRGAEVGDLDGGYEGFVGGEDAAGEAGEADEAERWGCRSGGMRRYDGAGAVGVRVAGGGGRRWWRWSCHEFQRLCQRT